MLLLLVLLHFLMEAIVGAHRTFHFDLTFMNTCDSYTELEFEMSHYVTELE